MSDIDRANAILNNPVWKAAYEAEREYLLQYGITHIKPGDRDLAYELFSSLQFLEKTKRRLEHYVENEKVLRWNRRQKEAVKDHPGSKVKTTA